MTVSAVFPERVPPDAPTVAVLRREEAVREGDTLVVPCIVTSQPEADVRYVSISGFFPDGVRT